MQRTARLAVWSAAAVLGCASAPPPRPEPAPVEWLVVDEGSGFQDPTVVAYVAPIVLDLAADAGTTMPPDATSAPEPGAEASVPEAEEEGDAGAVDDVGDAPVAWDCPRVGDGGSHRHGGAIDGGAVRAAVSRKRAAFQACYGDFMMRVRPVEVHVDARFVVDRSGETDEIAVCLSVDDPTLESCIEEVFRSIEYPRPEGGRARIYYPIDMIL
ncbi:MAG: AgmX/PglI C-terminal domain-containing protein [Deltaproteobacteria bacterium]|nr:AgmX/PglI C-terminal domain-containing protein [Deltaproteobacteria bacterium]